MRQFNSKLENFFTFGLILFRKGNKKAKDDFKKVKINSDSSEIHNYTKLILCNYLNHLMGIPHKFSASAL